MQKQKLERHKVQRKSVRMRVRLARCSQRFNASVLKGVIRFAGLVQK